jgi:HD-like signal output (HDOD) protein
MVSPPDRATSVEHSELVLLTLLLDDSTQRLWSLDELARELGSELHAADAVASLFAAGLTHRCGELVLATRAAVRFSELLGGI